MNEDNRASREKLELLFEAATRRFGEYGYSESTVESIAEEAGVSKGTLYYYFDSKEELFLQLFRNLIGRFEGYLDFLEGEGTAAEGLVELHRGLIAAVHQTAGLGKLMIEFWANASRKKNWKESSILWWKNIEKGRRS